MQSFSKLKQTLSGVIGLLVLALIVGFFRAPIEAIKWLGAPLLFLPSLLGITPIVSASEIQTLSLYQTNPIVRVDRAGQYAVFTDDRQVLSRANMLEGIGVGWMSAQLTGTQDLPTGQAPPKTIDGSTVLRGVRPYDPVTVPGRAIITFGFPEAGRYVLSYPPQSGTVYFVPDYVTGREVTIALAVAAQIIVVVLVVIVLRWPQLRRSRQLHRLLAHKLAQKRAKDEAFWQAQEREDTQQ